MNTHKNPVRNILSVAALTLCLTVPVALADSIGDVSYQADGFSVLPTLGQKAAGYQLTVSGPDGYHAVQTFKGAELPAFDAAGLADGAYSYELVAIPAKKLEAGSAQRLVQSGSFSITAGSIADPTLVEGGLEKAQVFADDVIVQGSACVGVDCASSESFGFDTLRLKENNLRIHFDDSSGSASFPNNDWRLTANDSSNGGANKFTIDDVTGGKVPVTFEAGANANTAYIASEGRLGVKTNNPVVDIHAVNGNTPTLRLEQDGSSGFQSQSFDIAANETNFFIRDVTNSSKLPFKIKPGAPDNALFIYADDDVGMGTADGGADAALHVRRTDGTAGVLVEEASSTLDNTRTLMQLENNGATRLRFENTSISDAWVFIGPQSNQDLVFNNTGNSTNELELSEQGNLELSGSVTVTGGCSGCDAVFSADWPLESIEEHAAFMWENKYLPAVGPTEEGRTQIDVFAKTTGILQELEKAHIYIEQIHDRMEVSESRLDDAIERAAKLRK